MRGALAATAVISAVGLAPAASADPHTKPPTNTQDALSQYKELSGQAEKTNEQYLTAKTNLDAKRKELANAKSDTTKALQQEKVAKAQEGQFRGRVDKLSEASYQGARFNKMSAMVTGESPKDFLNRASALQVIASDNDDALNKLRDATGKTTDARNRAAASQSKAQNATNAADQLVSDIQARNRVLQQQMGTVKDALNKLDAAAKAKLADQGGDANTTFIPGSGVGGKAMELALGQRGVPYEWGGETPSGFDCSGLTKWAFGKVGVQLPHSASSQQSMGQEISRDALQPGDLVFFGSPAHHVGIYVGNDKMVDAPDFGQTVKVEPLNHDYSGARRLG
jgi:cell wall-associated NlpC family hydrolase